jgi:hypothetical protein
VANYGDVALSLPANWDRLKLYNKEDFIQTVGHKEGVADACLTKEKDAEHQFYWVDPRDYRAIASLKVNGYDFVTKETWTINEDLWQWNADGRASFGVEVLMARPKAKFIEAEAQRAAFRDSKSKKERDEELRAIERAGISVEDERGRRVARSAAR